MGILEGVEVSDAARRYLDMTPPLKWYVDMVNREWKLRLWGDSPYELRAYWSNENVKIIDYRQLSQY